MLKIASESELRLPLALFSNEMYVICKNLKI